jgi:3-methyladenine DNA glycosylase AlkD
MAKKIFAGHGMYTGKQLKEFVEGCYDQPYREVMYAGIEMMQRMLKYQSKSFIRVLEKCITTHSWWDTVDWLSKLVGYHFEKYPELQQEYSYKWIGSDNMWLQRAAIIHQLAYKTKTDEKLLFDLIDRKSGVNEFFIRKACGWALREYSKTNPKAVKQFVKTHNLSPLTQKEALRLIQ